MCVGLDFEKKYTIKRKAAVLVIEYILLALSAAAVILLIVLLAKQSKNSGGADFKQELLQENRQNRVETSQAITNSISGLQNMILQAQNQTAAMQDQKLAEIGTAMTEKQSALQESITNMVAGTDKRMNDFTLQSQAGFETLRASLDQKLQYMQQQNEKKLEEMRQTVDEKLQKTLEVRISESFRLVNDRLEQVYKGLGEMQTLAVGVGDLKKVLSNVKTRGTLGEIQLGAILAEILSPEQYDTNVVTQKGSKHFVEFAVRLPGSGDEPVYLPIDSKFPTDTYQNLLDAYDTGDGKLVEEAKRALIRNIKDSAKEIRDKYIDPPNTTDFAILFLPVEGLYAEVVKNGLVETLQAEYRINIAGPTTMAALLNSLQMGFRTLAIQKRSAEVWDILSAAKTEFNKFEDVLRKAQGQIESVNKSLDQLVGTRTRKIQRCLKAVHTMQPESADALIESAESEEEA